MSGDSGPVVPSEPDSATPEPARTLRGLLRNLKGPAAYGVILSLYVVIGGLAWLIIQSQPARQSVQPAIDPLLAPKPTRAAELTVVATAVPAPVVEPLPTAAVRPAPPGGDGAETGGREAPHALSGDASASVGAVRARPDAESPDGRPAMRRRARQGKRAYHAPPCADAPARTSGHNR